jgi:hypothetical protein
LTGAVVVTSPKLIEAPASTDSLAIETLGYIDAYDAVLNCDYALVAYKETENDGTWRVRVRSSQTAGGVFEPEAMRLQARSTGAQGKPYFVWGFNMEPSAGDPRRLECRVHVAGGKPSSIEMVLQLRKFDGTADEEKSVSFPWP